MPMQCDIKVMTNDTAFKPARISRTHIIDLVSYADLNNLLLCQTNKKSVQQLAI